MKKDNGSSRKKRRLICLLMPLLSVYRKVITSRMPGCTGEALPAPDLCSLEVLIRRMQSPPPMPPAQQPQQKQEQQQQEEQQRQRQEEM